MSHTADWDFRCKTFLWKADVPVADSALRRLPELRESAFTDANWVSGWRDRIGEALDIKPGLIALEPISTQGTFHCNFSVLANGEKLFLKTVIPTLIELGENLQFESWLSNLEERQDIFSVPQTIYSWSDGSEFSGRIIEWIDADSFYSQLNDDDSSIENKYRNLGVTFSGAANLILDRLFQAGIWGWFHPDGIQKFDTQEKQKEQEPKFDTHRTFPQEASSPIISIESHIPGFRSWEDYFFGCLENHFRLVVDDEQLEPAQLKEFWKWMESSEIHSLLSSAKPALLHGDPGASNIYWDADRDQVGMADWEDRMIGDPYFGLAGWATFFKSPSRLPFVWEGMEESLPTEHKCSFEEVKQRFWLYYWRVALAKSAHRLRFGYADPKGSVPAICRVLKGFQGWLKNADFTSGTTWRDPVKVDG